MPVVMCEVCNKCFNKTFNLRRHFETVHGSYVPHDQSTSQNAKISGVKCEICKKCFNKTFNLMRHYNNVHDSYIPQEPTTSSTKLFICPICNEKCTNARNLNRHLLISHEIELQSEQLSFSDENEFYSWKASMEDRDSVNYVKTRGEKRNRMDTRIIVFYCNRSGYYRETVSTLERKRHMKSQGSSKIGAYCPAQIKAIFNDGQVTVDFCNTHVGHEIEIAHIPLPYQVKKELASKIEQKMPFDEILTEVDCTVSDKLKRKHLLTKRDLRNIAKEFSINSKIMVSKSKMYPKCYVKGCTTIRKNKEENNIFFNFPKATKDDGHRYMIWAEFAQNREIYVAGQRRLMCSKHFDISQFDTKSKKKRLLPTAIPTLFPPTDKTAHLTDHDYSMVDKREHEEAQSTLPQSPEADNDDMESDTVIEVLNENQAQERILKLMHDVDSLTGENIFLKKENIKCQMKNAFLEDELKRWKACAKAVVSKAKKNVNYEYIYHKRELGAIRKQLKLANEEIRALKKGKQNDAPHANISSDCDEEVSLKCVEKQVEKQDKYDDVDASSSFMVDVAEEVECGTVWEEATIRVDGEVVVDYEELNDIVLVDAQVIQEEDMICEVVFDDTTMADT